MKLKYLTNYLIINSSQPLKDLKIFDVCIIPKESNPDQQIWIYCIIATEVILIFFIVWKVWYKNMQEKHLLVHPHIHIPPFSSGMTTEVFAGREICLGFHKKCRDSRATRYSRELKIEGLSSPRQTC